jgi:toxin ParE1/3/4
MIRVTYSSAAEEDLATSAAFIQRDSVNAAVRLLDSFDKTVKQLQHSPLLGSQCRFANPHFEGMRLWPVVGFRNYLIYYVLRHDVLEIVRILHSSRDVGLIFGESEQS